jgi:hypothetical protein
MDWLNNLYEDILQNREKPFSIYNSQISEMSLDLSNYIITVAAQIEIANEAVEDAIFEDPYPISLDFDNPPRIIFLDLPHKLPADLDNDHYNDEVMNKLFDAMCTQLEELSAEDLDVQLL